MTHASATDAPSAWIERFAHLVHPGGSVLDVAAGQGRHARLFAARGGRVTAVDRSAEALDDIRDPAVSTLVADLEDGPWPLGEVQFDAIVVVHYLHRPLLARLRAALAPGGVVLYDTFMQGNEAFGRPTNAAFLLAPGELLEWAAEAPPLRVVAFEQGLVASAGRRSVIQRIAAVDARRAGVAALEAPSADHGLRSLIG